MKCELLSLLLLILWRLETLLRI